MATVKVVTYGGSAFVRLPKQVMDALQIKVGDDLALLISHGNIELRRRQE